MGSTHSLQHPLSYRREITTVIFQLLRSGESAAVVGPASMGKSRLLQFLLRPDVQQHYLGDAAGHTWLVLADCNRLAEASEWGLYELLLTSLTEEAGGRLDADMRGWLNDLRREAITGANALLARRHVELATRVLCREHGLRLYVIFDEFDELYRSLPPAALANLRALRDTNKYSICYILMLRDHPARLRSPAEVEGFYELVSRSVIGLKPYGEEDARRVIAQIAARRKRFPTPEQEKEMLWLSGGHPGLLVALSDVLVNGHARPDDADPVEWALEQPQVVEECRKLWEGLAQDEQLALGRLAQGIGASYSARQLLLLKGLIRSDRGDAADFFSPLLAAYARAHSVSGTQELWLDEADMAVWVEGRRIELSGLKYDLLRYLYRRSGQVCTRDEIIGAIYRDEAMDPEVASSGNRLDSLVRHLRQAIEPVPSRPRYLLSVRGQGYRLVAQAHIRPADDTTG